MTETQSTQAIQEPYLEFEFNPRPYIETFIKHWKLILGLAFTVAVAAFLAGTLRPAYYTAEADVSLLNIHSEIVFDEQFKTVPLEEGLTNQSQQADNRREALQALAKSQSLLIGVFAEVSPQLGTEEQDFEAFLDAIEAQTAGDLLRLRVTWDDPEIAAAIANEWARRFSVVANQSYVSTSGTPDEADAAASAAFEKYQAAQEMLEAFVAENDLDLIRREVAELDVLAAERQAQKIDLLRLTTSTPISSSIHLADTTRNTLLRQMELSIEGKANDRARILNDWYDRKANLERLQIQLKDMKGQLEEGNTSAAAASGDALALVFARAGLFGQEGMPELLLDVDLAQLSETGQDLTSADVEGLLHIVEDGLDEANGEIKRLTEELFRGTNLDIPGRIPEDHELFQLVNAQVESALNADVGLQINEQIFGAGVEPLDRTLDQLSDQRQVLSARLENLEARQRELTRARDTAWGLYTTLDNKAREVDAQFATGAPQVRLAVQALPPLEPDPRGRLMLSLIAAGAGGLIAIVYVFGREYWKSSAPTEAPSPSLPQPPPTRD
jgi:capsular polysaccharide biosynthesis protein